MRDFTPRRWTTALVGAAATAVLLGVPTALIPNPVFARMIEAPAWAVPAWLATSALAGLLLATYVRPETPRASKAATELSTGADEDAPTGSGERHAAAGGLLALFAVGCPTCNALVVLALVANGAIAWFEPVQPLLAIGGIALLGIALRSRLRSERACTPRGRTLQRN